MIPAYALCQVHKHDGLPSPGLVFWDGSGGCLYAQWMEWSDTDCRMKEVRFVQQGNGQEEESGGPASVANQELPEQEVRVSFG